MTSTPISNPVKGRAIYCWRSTCTWTLSSRRDAGVTSAGGLRAPTKPVFDDSLRDFQTRSTIYKGHPVQAANYYRAGGLSHSKGTNMADRLFKTALILAIVCVVVVVCVVFLVYGGHQ